MEATSLAQRRQVPPLDPNRKQERKLSGKERREREREEGYFLFFSFSFLSSRAPMRKSETILCFQWARAGFGSWNEGKKNRHGEWILGRIVTLFLKSLFYFNCGLMRDFETSFVRGTEPILCMPLFFLFNRCIKYSNATRITLKAAGDADFFYLRKELICRKIG